MNTSFPRRTILVGAFALSVLAHFSTAIAQTQRWTRIVGTGDVAPGTGGSVFDEIQRFAINDSGQIAITATIDGPGVLPSNRFGLWSGSTSGLGLLLRQGELYIPFTNFGGVEGFDLNNSGEIAAIVNLEGSAPVEQNDEAIFLFSGGSRTLLLREGEALTAATDFGDFAHQTLRLQDDGRIAFEAALVDADPLEEGYFAGNVGAFDTAVRRGHVAPGLGNFDAFNGQDSAMRDAPGLTTVVVKGSQGATEGLWVGVNGLLSEIAVEGDPTPFGGGHVFTGFEHATIEPGGRIIFGAGYQLGGHFESGLFSYTIGGGLSTLFRAGDPAPGFPGFVLDSFDQPFQNGNGRFGFEAEIAGPGVGPTNNRVLYVQDGGGRFVPVMRSGSPIAPDVEPNRTVEWFSLNPVRGFAAKNRVLVRVHFTDGGVALYQIETGIPETIIRGKKRPKTSRKRLKVRGFALDDEAISQVHVQIGRKKWRLAKGSNPWRQKVKIRKKRTPVFVRSFDVDGNVSSIQRVTIRRR